MISQELLAFIKKSISEGSTKEQIKIALSSGGWSESDIEEGYVVATNPVSNYQSIPQVKTENKTVFVEFAGFWIRVLAYFIDVFVCVIFMIPFFVFSEDTVLLEVVLSIIVLFYLVFTTKKYQATLGKMAVGIKVISEKSENLTWGQVILRETIGKIISGLIFSIGYLAVAFTSKKQGFHDLIARTLVVYK
ncbi:MAG: hypothetical protein UR85_C0013G0005 [Candidatus Nomurabacteria bacterium GW2011_GWF2_35_66]|uniref:RDD domain-containing protein n=1 Tax=Candidatus Nomurabacteria bacterium GW2011_GWE1_35_16 TaxID=1618761 RepID=A0A0G0B8K7_9BACT|nr:MAG: hypothetical protein UR55_C0018G0006 [Candidatus Nomurabacteria bacterium GW2011_GWF1_34_20]KKP62882.1 MAG: hypothetical protein UR57_C0010G0046 [Candidatus Nomurabacteria bacterium GW2011_GWE2_34_25]KKP65703.1 MAG: hypothetical protein UR64_C0020G0006 [Candidatus Nomurabacteria bacterium GW2011_GWE1_35_16]KKP82816.1 MAG: hypothetical protein UR85_C0013G0005 [Candidatus Nomurabacteria bacterium GW2011_GWF2_35_66]HAE36708.1 RDD family protein [Candidatus Nomurabacteria bacterium]